MPVSLYICIVGYAFGSAVSLLAVCALMRGGLSLLDPWGHTSQCVSIRLHTQRPPPVAVTLLAEGALNRETARSAGDPSETRGLLLDGPAAESPADPAARPATDPAANLDRRPRT